MAEAAAVLKWACPWSVICTESEDTHLDLFTESYPITFPSIIHLAEAR